ncbi:uncharacterized protein B0H18DRAFT_1088222 [Fomitopsis serialis]|uniref:uncharacterized protein n=1 Tax=Fomitopsis serialis TaxID=139415 RepID=UPI002007D5D9|nr:uncharacterized protein B0H18DRAFT_1088222 [Neoantrodia serialis]KAH9913016.1 hypothetical protein B0H18DRAFT_1088222 [Neoantrodia serialis]
MSTLQEQLSTLAACIQDKPPYCSGTLRLPAQDLTMFYGKDSDARRINFAQAGEEDIEHVAQSCDIATFGVNQKDVHDESYRKAGKLDAEHFSPKFDPTRSGLLDIIGTELMERDRDSPSVRAELYKLNVYGPGYSPQCYMFGSLVVVYPSPHEGGTLVLRHEGKEWTFDSSKILANQQSEQPCLAYIAFFSDVEHEVLEVKSGYRITITYNLYFKPSQPPLPPAHPFTFGPDLKAVLQRLLEDPTFLPKGGHLGFGLSHRYPVERRMDARCCDLQTCLKGGDAVIMKVCTDLGLKSSLKFLVEDTDMTIRKGGRDVVYVAYIMLDRLVDTHSDMLDGPMRYHLRDMGGRLVTPIPPEYRTNSLSKPDVLVRWVVRPKRDANLKSRFIAYGNEPSVGYEYAHLCVVVDVGKFGERQLGEVEEIYSDDDFGEASGTDSDDDRELDVASESSDVVEETAPVSEDTDSA